MLKGYDKQAEYLSWGPGQKYRDDYHQPNGVLNLPNGEFIIEHNYILAFVRDFVRVEKKKKSK